MTKSLTRGLLAQELSCSEPAERQLYHDNFNLAYSERADRRMAQFQITTGNGLPPTNGLHALLTGLLAPSTQPVLLARSLRVMLAKCYNTRNVKIVGLTQSLNATWHRLKDRLQ